MQCDLRGDLSFNVRSKLALEPPEPRAREGESCQEKTSSRGVRRQGVKSRGAVEMRTIDKAMGIQEYITPIKFCSSQSLPSH